MALRLHNAKLKDELEARGLTALGIPARLSNLRISEEQKDDFRRQLGTRLSQSPMTPAEMEQQLASIRFMATAAPVLNPREAARRPKTAQRSPGSVFFESLQRDRILSAVQVRELRQRLSRQLGPLRQIDPLFFLSMRKRIDQNPGEFRENPSRSHRQLAGRTK